MKRLEGMLKGFIKEWKEKRAWATAQRAYAWAARAQRHIETYQAVLDLLLLMETEDAPKEAPEK